MLTDERVVLLAGGVGGARIAEGLAASLPADALTIIANVGDDESFHGLHVSPDIDTLIYTLSGRIDRTQGWGVREDALRAQTVLAELGAPVWMKLGDSDLGLHIWRSWRLSQGQNLSAVTETQAERMGAGVRVLPATDDRLRTRLRTEAGWLDFQEWFVGARSAPRVLQIEYHGAESARLTDRVQSALDQATLVIIAPSNPLLSINPILAVPGMLSALKSLSVPRVAISPLIRGKAIKGPLDQLIGDLGMPPGAAGVAAGYRTAGVIDGFVLDNSDVEVKEEIRALGLQVLSTDILMPDPGRSAELAQCVLRFAAELRSLPAGGLA